MWYEKILSFLQTPKGLGVLGLVAIGFYLIYKNGYPSFVSSYVPQWLGGTAGEEEDTTVPSRREVWDNLEANYDYFKSVNCPDGMKLMEDAAQHVFHEHTVEVDATNTNAASKLIKAVSEALKKPEATPTSTPSEN